MFHQIKVCFLIIFFIIKIIYCEKNLFQKVLNKDYSLTLFGKTNIKRSCNLNAEKGTFIGLETDFYDIIYDKNNGIISKSGKYSLNLNFDCII